MGKQKIGFWKTHPLLKAITVLVVFFLMHYCPTEIPVLGTIVYVFYFFYMWMGVYILGCLYGIWLDHRCHLKIPSFCLVFLILIVIVSIDYFFNFVYPYWKQYGYIVWEYIRSSIYLVYAQILSVVGGYILSKIIAYFVGKYRKARGITN